MVSRRNVLLEIEVLILKLGRHFYVFVMLE